VASLNVSMSSERTHPPLARLETWLPGFDRAAAERVLGGDSRTDGAERDVRVEGRPRPLASQLVRARVREGAQEHEASAGLAPSGDLACHCDCAAFATSPPCPHVAALVRALGDSRPLREEVLAEARPAGGDGNASGAPPPTSSVPDRARALALVREHGIDGEGIRRRRGATLLDASFQGWRRRGDIRPLGDAVFHLAVEGPDPDQLDAAARLVVRVQPKAERRPFGPDDLESRRLPAAEWRLFEPLARAAAGAKTFAARGDKASLFLERAADAQLELREEGTGYPIHVLDAEVRPALRLRSPVDGEVGRHPVVVARAGDVEEDRQRLAAAWRRYRGERGAIAWDDFLRLVGVDPAALDARADAAADPHALDPVRVLEATWVAARRRPRTTPAEAEPELPGAVAFGDAVLFGGARAWAYLRPAHAFARVAHDVGPIALARLEAQPTILVSSPDVGRLPPLLREQFRGEGVQLPRREELGLPALPVPRVVLRLTGSPFSARATLEARYGNTAIALTPETRAHPDDPARNADVERGALELVAATTLALAAPAGRRRAAASASDAGAPDHWAAEGDAAVHFWTRDLPRLVAVAGTGEGIDEVVVPPGLRQIIVRGPIHASLAARTGRTGLIDVALRYATEGVDADVDEIRQALAAKRRWVKLTDGSVAELSERVASLASATRDVLRRSPTAELPRSAIGEIAAWRELADRADLDARVTSWSERLRNLAAADPGEIAGLRADLRAYQRTGVAWLQILADLGVGGILADDMGLGKTVQALALLAWRAARDGRAPSLVVAPTSVALNWIREAERFVPDLRPLLLHGIGRHERYEDVPDCDVVVTTYALLRRDVSRLRDIGFRYVILDEAQHIKNHAAATTAAAKSLRAEARLALTGTPVENRLLELWSILDFCNPGMLGTWRSFAQRYERPVAEALVDDDPAAGERDANGGPPDALVPEARDDGALAPAGPVLDEAASLRARIRPFVLRRTKADVQRDLPPKIETDVAVELTVAQRRAYAALAAAIRSDLAPKLASGGIERNRMLVLTALLRLRQMACDPRLVDPRHKPEDSAKLLALRELVSEVIAGGRRALVFSQFVELLSLVRRDLDERGVPYSYLDGRTRDRQGVIDGFVQGAQPVFLLSLRAGGTGINLAAADVVIHLDPWWNPAVEDQATDRAHRIGQQRTVSVYRIVAVGTIEEAILRMKERKRALASAVIEESSGAFADLDASDLEELLRFSG